jgi:energy-coupling factor transporter ATP-binding protein EcfA2
MFVRLAFAAAIHVDPEIILVDEALAVGDAVFQHQCLLRIREMQTRGTTVVFVSHDMGMIKAISSWVVLLDAGRIDRRGRSRRDGEPLLCPCLGGDRQAEAPHGPVPTLAPDSEIVRFQQTPAWRRASRVPAWHRRREDQEHRAARTLQPPVNGG